MFRYSTNTFQLNFSVICWLLLFSMVLTVSLTLQFVFSPGQFFSFFCCVHTKFSNEKVTSKNTTKLNKQHVCAAFHLTNRIWPSVWYRLVRDVVWRRESYCTFQTSAAGGRSGLGVVGDAVTRLSGWTLVWTQHNGQRDKHHLSSSSSSSRMLRSMVCIKAKRGTPNEKGYKVIENSLPSVSPQNLVRPRGWTEPPYKYEPTFSPPQSEEFTLEGWVASPSWSGPCEWPFGLF